MNKYLQPLLDTIALLLNPNTFHLGLLSVKGLKKELLDDFKGIDIKYKKYKESDPHDILNFITAFNYITHIEIYLNQKADVSISLDKLALLYYKYFRLNKNDIDSTKYLEMAVEVIEHVIILEPDNEFHLKKYHQYLKNFAHYIRSQHPEIAEELYFKIIDYCSQKNNEEKHIILIKSSCYDGLASIYLNSYNIKNISFESQEKFLDLSHQYYKKALDLLIKEKTFNEDRNTAQHIAHMLNTVLLKKTQHYIDVIRNETEKEPKIILLKKLEKCYEEAIFYAEEYNERRKLGNAKYQYANFMLENYKILGVNPEQILLKLENAVETLLYGFFQEGQMSRERYDRSMKILNSISHSKDELNIKFERYRGLRNSLIKKPTSVIEHKKLKRKYSLSFYQTQYNDNNNFKVKHEVNERNHKRAKLN